MNDTPLQAQTISCELRPNPLNRRLKLSFRPGKGFLVTYPPRTSRRAVDRFLESNRKWMEQVIANHEKRSDIPSLREYLEEYPSLYLGGHHYTIHFRNAGGLFKVGDEVISIFPEITDRQLVKKLRKLAEEPLKTALRQIAAALRLQVATVQIRDQQSRWGSCSAGGRISLNWRLILMPPDLQQHIMLHELAHIVHPDHSPQFWALLENWDSDTRKHKALLKKQGKIWIQLGR